MARRTVLAILPFDPVSMADCVRGTAVCDNEPVVRYRTNAAKPTTEYLWLTKFAYWAGAEVGCVTASKRVATSTQVMQLTAEVSQDATTADGDVAYLVFTAGESDYSIFTDQSEAVATALDEAVMAGRGERWRVYPLYAGAPITG